MGAFGAEAVDQVFGHSELPAKEVQQRESRADGGGGHPGRQEGTVLGPAGGRSGAQGSTSRPRPPFPSARPWAELERISPACSRELVA